MTTTLGDPNTSDTVTAANGQVSKPFVVKKHDGTELFSVDKDGNITSLVSTSETTETIKTKLGAADADSDGYLTSTDWGTFNGKQAALSNASTLATYAQTEADLSDAVSKKHAHTNASALDDVSGENTGDETQSTIKTKLGAASSGVDGYLSGSDFTTFASKAAGNHNHDLVYSQLGHTHAYAATDHNHDSAYVAKNNAISGATKAKITYDAKGLVTSGADIALTDLPTGTGFLKGSASTPSFVTFALTDIPSGTGILKASSSTPTYQTLSDSDIPSLDASKIATGQFVTACIPDLPASTITSGTFDAARLPAPGAATKGGVALPASATGTVYKDDGTWGAVATGGVVQAPDYIITNESGTYKAYLGLTGEEVSSNAAAGVVFQYAATALAASGGRIVVKPATYTFVTAVTLGSGTLIDAQGSVFDVTGLDDVVFSFGTDTAAGWQWSATSTAGEKQTGLINANFNGTITNSSTLAVRISQVNAGAIVENISTKRVYNVVEIRGACYGAVVRNVKGHYTAGTFIKLVAEYLTSVAYQPNDATIDHCEMSSFSETCIGVDNTTDGNGSSVPASGVTITRCWLESMHKCIRTEGSSMKISNCVLSTIATGTDHIAIEQTATAKFLIINGCSISSDNESGSLISIKAHYSVNNCTFNYFKCPAIVQENASGIYCQVTNNHFWPDGSATALTVISGKLQYSHICNNRFMSSNDVHTGISALSGSSLNVISGNIFSNLLVGLTGYSIISAITGNAFNGCPDGVIATNMGTDCTFTGNEFYSCAATISGHTPTPNDVGNMGYIVKKAGTATITNGQASIAVTHGMTGTPTKVTATGSTADTNALYVDTVGASQFTIHAAGNVGGNRTVYWYAEV